MYWDVAYFTYGMRIKRINNNYNGQAFPTFEDAIDFVISECDHEYARETINIAIEDYV